VLGLGLVVAWIVWLSIVIVSEPPAGAASAEDLRERVAVAFNAADAEALAGVLAAPLTGDGEFATEYVTRLREAGAQRVSITSAGPDRLEVRGEATGGSFGYSLVIVEVDARWFVSFLPPV